MYELIAHSYDGLHGEEQLLKYSVVKEFLKDYETINWKWLDIGSGTGLAQEFFKDSFNSITCIEPVKELVSIHLLKKRPGLIINTNIENAIKFLKQNSFDIVTAFTSLHHVDTRYFSAIEKLSKNLIVVSMLKYARNLEEFKKFIKGRNILLKKNVYKDLLVIWKR